jgi:hypothetical protein
VSYDLRFLFLRVLVLFRLLHSGALSEDADKNMFVKDKHCKANDKHCKANEHPVCFVSDENQRVYVEGYKLGYKVGYKVGWQGGDGGYGDAMHKNDNTKDFKTNIADAYCMYGYDVGYDEGIRRGHAGFQEMMSKHLSKNDNDDKNDDKKKEDAASPVHIWPSWVHCAVCRNEKEFEDTEDVYEKKRNNAKAWICGTCGASISWGPLPGKTAEEDIHMCTIIVDMNDDTNDNTKDDAARNAAALGPKDA